MYVGMRASNTAELVFDNVKVPAANIVGEVGGATLCMMRNLEIERIVLAAMSLGVYVYAYVYAYVYVCACMRFVILINLYLYLLHRHCPSFDRGHECIRQGEKSLWKINR